MAGVIIPAMYRYKSLSHFLPGLVYVHARNPPPVTDAMINNTKNESILQIFYPFFPCW